MSEVKKDDKNSWKVILLQRDPPTIKYEEALVQARKHYMEIYNDGTFLKLERERLREILNSDELNVENEQVVFESVKRWLEYNFEYYSEHIKPLLRVVRFSQIPFKYLFDEVEPFIFPFEDCRDIYMNFLHDYILGENKVKAATRKYQNISTTISNSKTAESGGRLLSIGSDRSNTVASLEEYNAEKNQWTRLKDLDIGKINYSVAIVDENLLIIGGYLANSLYSNEVDSLNLRTGKHSQLAPLNYRRQNSATAVFRQEKLAFVYVIGGMKDERLLNSVERWDSSIRTWTMVTPMSVARVGHGAVFLQNKIYVVGGKTAKETYDNTVEAYDYENDRWTPKASMNNPNAYFGITTFKNHIYVAGGNRDAATPVNTVERYDPLEDTWTTIANISSTGMVGISSTSNRLICAGGKSSNLVEEYDESKNTWRKLKPLDTQGSGFLVEFNLFNHIILIDIEIYSGDWIIQRRPSNRLIFLGGWKLEDAKVAETFDVVDKKWTRLKDFTSNLIKFCPIITSNKLLLIGGYDDMKKHWVDLVRAIDLSSGAFQSFPPLKHARSLSSSVVVTDGKNTSLYVLGGFNDGSLSSVEKWDSSTNEWTEEIPMTFPRHGHSCVFLHGKIYAVGGGDKGKALDTVEAFHVKNKSWETKTSMNQKRLYFGIILYNDQIYVAGGYNDSKGLSSVERYDPPTDTWTTLADIQSRGQVGLCTLGDRLICAGGWKNTTEEYDFNENKWISLPSKNKAAHFSGYLLELPENAKLGNW